MMGKDWKMAFAVVLVCGGLLMWGIGIGKAAVRSEYEARLEEAIALVEQAQDIAADALAAQAALTVRAETAERALGAIGR